MKEAVNEVVLMLGGNVGDTRLFFIKATDMASHMIGPVLKISSLYSSAPWGFSPQRNFLNQALVLKTALDPFQVYEATHSIEKISGKNSNLKNGPRTLDIDILFYNELIINASGLEIPHPRLHLRRFNLTPLAEIIPDFVHPVLKENISSLLEKCTDPLAVYKLNGD